MTTHATANYCAFADATVVTFSNIQRTRSFVATSVCFSILLCIPSCPGIAWSQEIGFVADSQNNQLISVDLLTAETKVVGPLATVDNIVIGGLAFDTSRRKLFGVSPTAASLFSVDRVTGEATLVGPFGLGFSSTMQGAAYDPFTDKIFASDTTSGQLVTINPLTGAALLIGPMGGQISGLAVNPQDGKLYGSPPSQVPGGLYIIDKSTAQRTLVGTDISKGYNGLAFDSTGTLFGIQNSSDNLYRIDTSDATATLRYNRKLWTR